MQKDLKVDKLALKMDTLSSAEVSPLPVDTNFHTQLPSYVLDLIQSSKITALEPANVSQLFTNGYIDIRQEKILSSSFLFVDLRIASSYATSRVIESVNPYLPPLVQKRLKKKMFSNFNLINFLQPACHARYNAWKKLQDKYVIVYDDLMEDYDGDAWAFLIALTEGLANDMCPEKAPCLGFVKGGFTALSKIAEIKSFLYSEAITNDTPSKSGDSQTDISMCSKSTPRKGTRALAIDIVPKKDASGKKSSLNLVINPKKEQNGNEGPVSAISSASPHDNAAPTDDYSRITNSIFVGSDVLPLSPNGPQLLDGIGVTHILNMAAEIKNSKIIEDSGLFKTKWIPVLDNIEVDMDQALQEAITFIDDAITQSPKSIVFVHCKAGRSRSVSAVIGYLVSKEHYTLKSAYDLVRKVRKGVSPNLGFMAALLKVEKDTHGENSIISSLYG